jgi:hypothetical protein
MSSGIEPKTEVMLVVAELILLDFLQKIIKSEISFLLNTFERSFSFVNNVFDCLTPHKSSWFASLCTDEKSRDLTVSR